MSPEETPGRIEPCLLGEPSAEVLDLVATLSGAAHALGARLPARSAAGLADLVRLMNCYYSNLIEGHNTRPHDIERALSGIPEDSELSIERRDLRLEALAHIRVQQGLDRDYAEGRHPDPASADFIRALHRAFYAGAPDSALVIPKKGGDLRMVPGEFRSEAGEEVVVGRHLPPSAPAVGAFMAHFEQRYGFGGLGVSGRILAIPAAHHRLSYIHPFLDGNGRVCRLMSHAMALQAGIGAHGLWSVSRGLARGLSGRGEYKMMMDHADAPRRGDLDGRGNLSRQALEDFTVWFLKVCLDQVSFMDGLFAFDRLGVRLARYVDRRELEPEASAILEAVFRKGELGRGEAARASGLKERKARDLLASLLKDGILGSDSPKGPVALRFPLDAVDILFPGLFPEL